MKQTADLQRLYIKNKLNSNIQKYEQEKNLQKEKQQKQKLLIKQQIFQQLMNKQKSNAQPTQPVIQKRLENNKDEYNYSFGSKKQQNLNQQNSQIENQNQTVYEPIEQDNNMITFSSQKLEHQENFSSIHNNTQKSETLKQKQKQIPSVRQSFYSNNSQKNVIQPLNIKNNIDIIGRQSQEKNKFDNKSQNGINNIKSDVDFGNYGRKSLQNMNNTQLIQKNALENQKLVAKTQNNNRQMKSFSNIIQSAINASKQNDKNEEIQNLFPRQQFRQKSPSKKNQYKSNQRDFIDHPIPPVQKQKITQKKTYKSYQISKNQNNDSLLSPSFNNQQEQKIIQKNLKNSQNSPYKHNKKITDEPIQRNSPKKNKDSQQFLKQLEPQKKNPLPPSKKNLSESNSSTNIKSKEKVSSNKQLDNPYLKNQQLPPLKKLKDSQNFNNQDGGGLYLTQDQHQVETPKPYGTYIKNNQDDDEYIQILRKKKIEEMQKKRLKRNQDKKKSVDEKKQPLIPSTYSNIHKKIKQQEQSLKSQLTQKKEKGVNKSPSKSIFRKEDQIDKKIKNIRDTSKQRQEKKLKDFQQKNRRQQLQIKQMQDEEQKKLRQQLRNLQERRNKDYQVQEKKREHSPYQTPKTITTNKTNKTGKPSIFEESPRHSRQKSNNRFTQQPKIQPRQRKNEYPKQKNKKIMINAITYVCLPGQINRKQRQKLLQVLDNDNSEFYIFLFKQYSRKVIKAIYTYDNAQNKVKKLYGQKAPNQLFSQNVLEFYRFDSGSRQFKILEGCKSFSYAVHAVYSK